MENNIYMKRKEIERELERIKEKEKKLEMRKEELFQKCNHEIVVSTDENDRFAFPDGGDYAPKYCLICGREYGAKEADHVFPSKTVQIDMYEYPKLRKKFKKNFKIKIENMYKLAKKDGCYTSEYEVGKDIKNNLNQMEKEE